MGEKGNLDLISLQKLSPRDKGAGTQRENQKRNRKEMKHNPRSVGQRGCVKSKLIWNTE